jgi:hypothetical protein
MVLICNTYSEVKKEKLHSYLYAYESILRLNLLPSVKVVAQILVYQGALTEEGCCITNETIAGLAGLERSTVQRQATLLTKAKIFTRYRQGITDSYTYHFNRNTEAWEVERYA